MLILTRKPGQLLRIAPHESFDPRMTVAELFHAGPIEILVSRIHTGQVRLGVSAHPGLLILRAELWPTRAQAVGVKRAMETA